MIKKKKHSQIKYLPSDAQKSKNKTSNSHKNIPITSAAL
jgi:hypothetical protein